MRKVLRRMAYLWNRRRMERQMAAEMAYHRERMPPERRAAFGSELRFAEDAREAWGWTWLDRLRQDLVYGVRVLRKSPGFSLTALLVLALGIGVPLTAFRQVLFDLQASSAPRPETLVQLGRLAPGSRSTVLPYPELAFFAANAHSFRAVIGVSQPVQAVFAEDAGPIRLLFATANYFPEFGIPAAHGRLFTAGDQTPDAEPVAVVAEPFWQRRLGGDTAVIGQRIRLNGKPVRLVGVLPSSVRESADVWMPLARQPYVIEGSMLLTDWSSALDAYARLAPGVSPLAAQQESRALAQRLRELRPGDVWKGEYLEARPILQLDRNSHEFLAALTAGMLVLLLLVAASANLGILVSARGVAREREIRTRMALGAGRARVVRQLFTESLLLAALSGPCALILSSVVLKAIQLKHNAGVSMSLFPGWSVLAATAAVAPLAALVFGLPPALRLTSATPHGGRSRTIFLSAQVAVSCLLLVVSSLMVGSLKRLGAIDPGFDYRHLIVVAPGLKAHGYDGPAAQAYLESLRTRAAGLPNMKAASEVGLAPWGNVRMGTGWAGRQFSGNTVDSHFLDTMNMQLVRGRNFLPGERRVAMVTDSAARLLWPDQDPLGKDLPWDSQGTVVVGVVRNASTTAIGATQPLEFYLAHSPADAPDSALLFRVSGNPRDFVRILQDAARGTDKRLQPVAQPVTDGYDRELTQISRTLVVISILGIVAILLSSIGLAGLAGYTVAQRTREIGLRMALGARSGHVVRAMLATMTRPIAVGFAFGALGGSAVARILWSAVTGFAGVPWFEPFAYLMAMALFVAVVALAVLAPARRAVRIDPGRALQQE